WLGIALGVVFVSWFLSGILFVYWGEPHITAQERLARMEPLDLSTARVNPGEAGRRPGISNPSPPRVAKLEGRPVYRFQNGKQWIAVYADSGERVEAETAPNAVDLLRHFVPDHASTIYYDTYLPDSDQWTLESAVRDLMPLHRISLGDTAGT